jgi:hypothetical protein
MACTIDYQLIREAQRLMTGANVHTIRTLIFCYEHSTTNVVHHSKYEELLTEFVRSELRVGFIRGNVRRLIETALYTSRDIAGRRRVAPVRRLKSGNSSV